MTPDDFLKVIVIGSMAFGGLYALLTVVRVWARKAEREQAAPAEAESARYAELQEGVQRLSHDVADLQERLDFAERLLAQHRDVPRVKGEV